jgi:hypothetical protein
MALMLFRFSSVSFPASERQLDNLFRIGFGASAINPSLSFP